MGVVLVLVFWTLFGCGGPEERKAEYFARAQEFFSEGNYPKTRVALRNVLKIDPKDAAGYFLFAQVEEKEENWRTAYEHYLRVVELNPSHRGALLKLGRIYLDAKAFDKLQEVTDKILEADPQDASAHTLLAAMAAVKGDLPGAVKTMEEILQHEVQNPDANVVLATLYTAQGNLEKAAEILRTAVQRYPDNIDLLTGLGAVLLRKQDWDGAEAAYTRVRDLEPQVFSHHTRLAAFYRESHNPDLAIKVFREAIEAQPDNLHRWQALAEFYVSQHNYPEAERTLLEAQQQLPRETRLSFSLGRLFELQQRPDQARKVYETLVADQEDKPAGLQARIQLARLDFADGHTDQAEQRVATVLDKNPRDVEALLMKGKLALLHQDGRTALEAFRTVVKDQPQAADVYVLLGQAYLMAGETNLAKDSFESAIRVNPALVEPQRVLAGLEAGQGRLKKAEERLVRVLAQQPDDLSSLGMLLGLQVSSKAWGDAHVTLGKIKEAGGEEFRVYLAEGQTHLAQQQWEKATHAFEQALALRPEEPAPLFGIIQVAIKQRHYDQAQARLMRMIDQQSDNPYAYGLLGEVLVLKGETEEAQKAFRTATTLKPDWPVPWIDQATLLLKEGNPTKVIPWLRSGFEVNPQSPELGILFASSLEKTGNVDEAIQVYERILAAHPQATIAANNLASLLTDQKGEEKDLVRALQLSESLLEAGMDNPYFLDTLGWVYARLGRNDEAIRTIQKAQAQAPHHPLINYHLGVAYFQVGNTQEAQTYLGKALQSREAFQYQVQAQALLSKIKG
jgi:tetratricopeptide (TPR) repeat protein